MCHFSLIILLLVSSTPFTARFEERRGEVEKLLFVRQSGKEFTTRVVDSFSRVALFVERERERENFIFVSHLAQTDTLENS